MNQNYNLLFPSDGMEDLTLADPSRIRGLNLDTDQAPEPEISDIELEATSEKLIRTLRDYRIVAQVVKVRRGPLVRIYELSLAAGIKASKISGLANDLARALTVASVRVSEVIPGSSHVGIEIPNSTRTLVPIESILDSEVFRAMPSPLCVALGKTITGTPQCVCLDEMPHLLIAGATGSGKSMAINALVISLLCKASPQAIRLLLIDPKMLELASYQGVPHLLTEVVTHIEAALRALQWCVEEMERRYQIFSTLKVRNLQAYNHYRSSVGMLKSSAPGGRGFPNTPPEGGVPLSGLDASEWPALPKIVVIIDEFADLMLTSAKKVEAYVVRLSQKSRAAGIHLVLATQRPSVDVITGIIKANIPARLALTTASRVDSRTILGQGGAERLLGKGDMLYYAPGQPSLLRIHGAFVQESFLNRVVDYWKAAAPCHYLNVASPSLDVRQESAQSERACSEAIGTEKDPLFYEAVSFVLHTGRPSISAIQRRFKIGYNRAARIVEHMEQESILSPAGTGGLRAILTSGKTFTLAPQALRGPSKPLSPNPL